MLTPREIVESLDKYIIGQGKAKRAVAIALRNRYRRLKLDEELRDDVCPKNIIMMGPTGVGKTEIARRLARLVDAPFVKVEATKFTEVGYVGRDVDSMIRDLIEVSVRMTKDLRQKSVQTMAQAAAENRIVDILMGKKTADDAQTQMLSLQTLLGVSKPSEPERSDTPEEEKQRLQLSSDLKSGLLEDETIEISVEQTSPQNGMGDTMIAMGIDLNVGDIVSGMLPKKKKRKKVKISEARKIFTEEEAERLIDMDDVIAEALERAEQSGIIFIDEMDKIAVSSRGNDHDVSREGVQRDILPVVEGCSVNTKYGIVHTDHILFIAAGAFHMSKVSDLIPELQGRFPIRVELDALTEEDFKLILTQPRNAAIKQYIALLAADNVFIDFDDEAIELIAKYAAQFNESCENIGARRLHTILENLLDEILFTAGENGDFEVRLNITAEYVKSHVSSDIGALNPDKYIV